jgi:16S rRNA processing protein RimM
MSGIPSKDELFELGYFSKLHGYKGELTAAINSRELDAYEDLEHIFVEVKDQLVPYMVESIEFKTKSAMKVKLEGIDTEDVARKLIKARIYITKEEMSESDESRAELRAIEGYKVFDDEFGEVGVVLHVDDNQTNPLIEIDANGKQVLLPLHEDFIEEVNHETKELHISAPSGLIEFYLAQ